MNKKDNVKVDKCFSNGLYFSVSVQWAKQFFLNDQRLCFNFIESNGKKFFTLYSQIRSTYRKTDKKTHISLL